MLRYGSDFRLTCPRVVLKDDYTTQQASVCEDLTGNVREFLIETDLTLRQLFEDHSDDVTKVAYLQKCLDINGMDALFETACCGLNG